MQATRLSTITQLCFGLVVFAATAQATNSYVATPAGYTTSVTITNSTNQEQPFWLHTRIDNGQDFDEQFGSVPARSHITLSLNELNTDWGIIKTRPESKLKIETELQIENAILHYEPTSVASTRVWLKSVPIFKGVPQKADIIVSNHGYNISPIQIEIQNWNGQALQTINDQLNPAQTATFQLDPTKVRLPLYKVRIQAKEKVTALLIQNDSQNQKALPSQADTPEVLSPKTTPTYFLMASRDPTDTTTFVVALEKPDLIEKARYLVAHPEIEWGRILIGKISAGHGEFNRNMTDVSRSPWAWHVSNAIKFADLASQECDGSPSMVDERLLFWLYGVKQICFWHYSVRKELSLNEVTTGH